MNARRRSGIGEWVRRGLSSRVDPAVGLPLEDGQRLGLVAGFESFPLFDVLEGCGFSHESEQRAEDE